MEKSCSIRLAGGQREIAAAVNWWLWVLQYPENPDDYPAPLGRVLMRTTPLPPLSPAVLKRVKEALEKHLICHLDEKREQAWYCGTSWYGAPYGWLAPALQEAGMQHSETQARLPHAIEMVLSPGLVLAVVNNEFTQILSPVPFEMPFPLIVCHGGWNDAARERLLRLGAFFGPGECISLHTPEQEHRAILASAALGWGSRTRAYSLSHNVTSGLGGDIYQFKASRMQSLPWVCWILSRQAGGGRPNIPATTSLPQSSDPVVNRGREGDESSPHIQDFLGARMTAALLTNARPVFGSCTLSVKG